MKLANLVFVFLAAGSALFGQSLSPVIGGVWSGNVSSTSATVAVRLNSAGLRVRLYVSQSEALTVVH